LPSAERGRDERTRRGTDHRRDVAAARADTRRRGRLWHELDQAPEGAGGRAQAARDVHREHRRHHGASPHGHGARRQRDRRGAGGVLRYDLRRRPRRRFRHRRGQRARYPRRVASGARPRDPGNHPHGPPLRRQVRRQRVQGIGRPPWRRPLRRQRARGIARRRGQARGPGLAAALRKGLPDGADPGGRQVDEDGHQDHVQGRPGDLLRRQLQLRRAVAASARARVPEPRRSESRSSTNAIRRARRSTSSSTTAASARS